MGSGQSRSTLVQHGELSEIPQQVECSVFTLAKDVPLSLKLAQSAGVFQLEKRKTFSQKNDRTWHILFFLRYLLHVLHENESSNINQKGQGARKMKIAKTATGFGRETKNPPSKNPLYPDPDFFKD